MKMPEPVPTVSEVLAAFMAADKAGTATEAQMIALWWAILAVYRTFPLAMKKEARTVLLELERRLGVEVVAELHSLVNEAQERRIAEAYRDGVMEWRPGCIFSLARADMARPL